MVFEGKVDFSANAFGITGERMSELDFLITRSGAIGRIYTRSIKDGLDWTIYIKPLTARAWIGILVFCIIVFLPMMTVKLGGRRYYTIERKMMFI